MVDIIHTYKKLTVSNKTLLVGLKPFINVLKMDKDMLRTLVEALVLISEITQYS